MRPLWLAAGTVCTIVAVLLAAGGVWHGFARAELPSEHKSRSIPFSGKQFKLEVVQGVVDVDVVTGEAGVVDLYRTLRWTKDKPTVKEDWDGRSLRLSVTCPGDDQPNRPACMAEYELLVPDETEFEATTTSGTLNVDGLHADVRVTSVSGNVRASGIAGNVWIRSASGDINTGMLAGDRADVETGSGEVSVDFDKPPSLVRAVARVSGNVTVRVPVQRYDVSVQAKWSEVAVSSDVDSQRKLTAMAPQGQVLIFAR